MRNVAVFLLLAGSLVLSSCAHDYHNPSVEADAAGSVSAPRLTTAAGGTIATQGSGVSDERKAKAQSFWEGAR